MLGIVENKKKRKRSLAKDWPPTSEQRKTLIPYGRPLKLPRLDEAPHKDVWMKIVSLALADLQGYKGCCRKMKYFGEVHRELLFAIATIITKGYICEPLRIKIRDSRCAIKYPNLRIWRVRGRGAGFDLRWIPDEEGVNVEKLIWINLTTGASSSITHFSRDQPRDIIRFIRLSGWEAFISDYIHGRVENHIRLSMYRQGEYNAIGSNTLKYLIWMAPKWVNRSNARSIVGELISRNPRMDQETSSSGDDGDDDPRDEIFPYLFS